MRVKWGVLFFALAAILVLAAGCGSKKKSSNNNTTTTTSTKAAKANKTFKAPTVKQPSSASGKPSKKTIAALPKSNAPNGKKPQLKGLEGKTVEEKLQILSEDIAGFWQEGFTKAGVQFTPATVNIVSQPIQVACNPPGTITPDFQYGSYYCSDDKSVNLPVGTLTKVDEDQRFGDAVMAGLIAVSFGFHIENVAGLKGDQGAQLQTATCLTGVWMNSVYRRGLLDNGDLQKIASTYPNQDAKVLVDAFNAGYTSGDPGKCVKSNDNPGTGP